MATIERIAIGGHLPSPVKLRRFADFMIFAMAHPAPAGLGCPGGLATGQAGAFRRNKAFTAHTSGEVSDDQQAMHACYA